MSLTRPASFLPLQLRTSLRLFWGRVNGVSVCILCWNCRKACCRAGICQWSNAQCVLCLLDPCRSTQCHRRSTPSGCSCSWRPQDPVRRLRHWQRPPTTPPTAHELHRARCRVGTTSMLQAHRQRRCRLANTTAGARVV